MKAREFITESAKLWSAQVRINQANYVGYVDAQVWAPNAQVARVMLKQQYNIQDHHVGSVKEIKMKAKEFVKEGMQDRINQAFQSAVQYVSGPMLPMVNGNYRLEDVMKRVRELKDAVARAKQKGRLNVNSPEYKSVMAELQKWAQWLQDSQDINKWHPERLKQDGVDPRATTDRIRAIQAELKQPVDSARRTALKAELEKLVADMDAWQRAMPVKEATGDDWFPVASQVSSDPNDVIPEVPDNFNPTIAYRKISLLRKELWRMQGLKYEERAKIVAEIRKLENQISLWMAERQSDPANQPTPVEADEGAPYTKYTRENGGTGQPFAKTREGAIRGAKKDIMQQKATDYLIVTDNNHEVVYAWSHYPREDLPKVGDTYQTQRLDNRWQASNQPRYPAGHPHAGAVMPPKI